MRRRRNRTGALLDGEGNWVEDKDDLNNTTVRLYEELSTPSGRTKVNFMRNCYPQISEEDQSCLQAEYSIAETKKALNGMGSMKAPGPDGYQALFFKRTWERTSHALHHFSLGVLKGEEFPNEAAEALLVLIPKEEKPSSLRSFRPISLCNVSMKIVSKMIVNRLKEVMQTIISPNQSSFAPGRQSLDNTIICQELLHSLKYTKASRGGTVLKLDMEKAYDRLSGNSLKNN